MLEGLVRVILGILSLNISGGSRHARELHQALMVFFCAMKGDLLRRKPAEGGGCCPGKGMEGGVTYAGANYVLDDQEACNLNVDDADLRPRAAQERMRSADQKEARAGSQLAQSILPPIFDVVAGA